MQQTKGANLVMQSMGSNSSGSSGWIGVQNKISDCFDQFTQEFQTQIDFFFKTYNQNLRESTIDQQLKGSKKDKLRYQQFLIHEERKYWEEFPRKLEVYNDYLRKMHELFNERSSGSAETSSTARTYVSLIVTSILNILPIASKKFCYRFGIDPVFHQDTGNNKTFDSLTEQQKMFDADDQRNWRILGFAVTIFASDILLILLEQSHKDVQLSAGVVSILRDICQYYSIVQVFTVEDIEEESILDIYFKQIQVTWAKIYGNLSKMSYDKCCKLMTNALNQDFRKMKEEDIQSSAQRIYFCRFLTIDPVDAEMASKIQDLLIDMNKLLADKNTTPQMKNVLMMTLKFLIDQLQYYGEPNVQSKLEFMQNILWPVIEQLYLITEKCRKKEVLKDYALQLQIVIIKVSPNFFFNEKMAIFEKSQRIQSYFEQRKTYNCGLQLIVEFSCLNAVPYNKYQDWNPKTQTRNYLLLEDKTYDVILPIKQYKSTENIKLMRKINASEQIYFPFSESFKLVFNPKMIGDITKLHLTYMKHMCYEDLQFTCTEGLQTLLKYLNTLERFDIPLLALKIIDYMLNPLRDFKNQYLKLQPKNKDMYSQAIKNLYIDASNVIKSILRNPVFMKTEYLSDLNNFYKSDIDQELCNDSLSMAWSIQNNGDLEGTFRRSTNLSQSLKAKKLGLFYLQEEKRVISFEEFREIQKMSSDGAQNEYQNEQLNQIAKSIQKEMHDWDYKKEKFIRHRISCFLSEERKEGQRQNTQQFHMNSERYQEKELAIQVIKMIHYLPEVQQLYKFFPLKRLLLRDNADLTSKVSEMTFQDIGGDDQQILFAGQQQIGSGGGYGDALTGGFGLQHQTSLKGRRKSGGAIKSAHANPKLQECQNLLPYLLMSTDYKILESASKQLYQIVAFGDFKVKLAVIDQMLYFLKELMIETPQESLVTQFLQQLIKMVKIWHLCEKNKLKVNEKYLKAMMCDGMEILSTNIFKEVQIGDDIQKEENSKIGTRMVNHQYLFDMMDMVSLLGCNSKDSLVRQLSVILMAESGKLKRLLIPKDIYKYGLYDIFYYFGDDIKELITKRMMIVNPFKQGEFKPFDEMKKAINELSPFLLIVDKFEYRKIGVTEHFVRDLQVMWIGEVSARWKLNLIEPEKVQNLQPNQAGPAILDFINIMCHRTLMIFDAKNDLTMAASKDFVGLNILMALVLYQITRLNFKGITSAIGAQQSQDGPLLQLTGIQSLLQLDITDIHKAQFGKFYPSRFQVSAIILGSLYLLQQPARKESYSVLMKVFRSQLSATEHNSYFMNCLVFFTLIVQDGNPKFQSYVQETMDDRRALKDFARICTYFKVQKVDIVQAKNKPLLILSITFFHGYLLAIQQTFKRTEYREIKEFISAETQYELLQVIKDYHEQIEGEQQLLKEHGWILPKIKQIWHMILSFKLIFRSIENIKLDLKFLVNLEKEGYRVLKYYKYLYNSNPNQSLVLKTNQTNLQDDVQQEFSVNELKYLLNQIYLFYKPNSNEREFLEQDNQYYDCFVSYIVDTKILLSFIKLKNFTQVYGQLTSSCLRSTKQLIEPKIQQFIGYGLHSKYFLAGLFMSLNSVGPEIIRQSKILCLSSLPLMFEDEKFREKVEKQIIDHPNVEELISHDNKLFIRFLKQVFKDEETYNMQNHFEKYFSISGFLRNLLNEIIKLQTLSFAQRMLIKLLDVITYFIGNLQLRRAPMIEDRNSFIFDSMIDFKSFEFLQKLYKISDKLIDFDDESIIMNMWFRVVEGKIQNFEILAKFLVHNLSSFIMKISLQQQQKIKHDGQLEQDSEYSYEYEKQKRYGLSIFNYIKARVQQMDLRNSINQSESSINWSSKIIKLMRKASLNLQSKYVLEKIKLKKILSFLHSEINECDIRLKLRGGLMNSIEVEVNQGVRVSLNMADLLQSQTFLDTFSAKNKKYRNIMKNVHFRVKRIMRERFIEIAGTKSVEQMPQMIIKYLENSLVFITNDVERPAQNIIFSLKEELTIVIVMIILILDLILREPNTQRYFFFLDTFNKLSIHVPSVQKYFNFKNFKPTIIFSKEGKVSAKIWQIVSLKASIEYFAVFTKLLFKIMQNMNSSPLIQYYLIKMWLYIFARHRDQQYAQKMQNQSFTSSIADQLQMKANDALQYSRNLILNLVQNSFFNIFEVVQTRKVVNESDFKFLSFNFKQHFTCILEYVLNQGGAVQGAKQVQKIKSMDDPESMHVAFATNTIFWMSYSCLETAQLLLSQKTNEQYYQLGIDLQSMAISAINQVLEKSDFLKMVISVSKLSPNFFGYNFSMQQRKSSLVEFIITSISNPACCEDALKSLIITIRIQDYQLLNASSNLELPEIELWRFLQLIPFMMQQFSYILNAQMNPNYRGKQPIFQNYRSIILLLKKSLQSVGIDKKKDIFDILDIIQKESEKNDDKIIKKEFQKLTSATILLMHSMSYHGSIFQTEETFFSIKDDCLECMKSGKEPVIDLEKIDMVLKIVNEIIVDRNISNLRVSTESKIAAKAKQDDQTITVYQGEILGENSAMIVKEFRPLYFGLKNIILKEIESIDREIDIQKFFFDQVEYESHNPANITSSIHSHSSSILKNPLGLSQQLGFGQKSAIISQHSGISPKSKEHLVSEPNTTSNLHSNTQQADLDEADFTDVLRKMTTNIKRQETTSKYQNSFPAQTAFTPQQRVYRDITDNLPIASMFEGGKTRPHKIQLKGEADDDLDPLLGLSTFKSGGQHRPITSKYQDLKQSTAPPMHSQLLFDDEPIQEALPFLRQKSVASTNHSIQRLDNKHTQQHAFETESKGGKRVEDDEDAPFDPTYDDYSEQQQYFKEQFEVIHEDQSATIEESKTKYVRHVNSFQDRVQQSKSIIYQGEEGGIITFAKHRGPQQQDDMMPSRTSGYSSKQPEILTNPNYVAERTSQIINDISQMTRSPNNQTHQNFYQHDTSSLHGESYNFRSIGELPNKKKQTQQELFSQYGWMNEADPPSGIQQRQAASTSSKISQSFFDSVKQERGHTSAIFSMGNRLEIMLAPFVNDGERMLALEKFLKNIKRYDPNYLKFYIDVLNLKQDALKKDLESIFHQAGVILQTYLAKSAIIIDQVQQERLLKEYETLAELTAEQRSFLFDANIFNPCLPEIERNLGRFLEEFISLGY